MPATNFNISRWIKIGCIVILYVSLFSAGYWGGGWLTEFAAMGFGDDAKSHEFHVLLVGLFFYAMLMAIPFVPGMELSLALFAVFGPKVAVAIYAATVIALTLSFLIGRLLPLSLIASIFDRFGFQRAKDLVLQLQPLSAQEKLDVLVDHAPKRIAPTLLRHRYLAVMVALNIPGNAIIGGGGGIGLLAGITKLYTIPRFIGAVSLATLPVPLFILIMNDVALW